MVTPGLVSQQMNYRIDQLAGEDDLLVFRVSGQLHAQALVALREVLGNEGGNLAVDLEEVTWADRETVNFLAVSEAQGIELRNCPAYIRDWIDRERRTE